MRITIGLIGAAICLAPSVAKADEDVCFINNSSSNIVVNPTTYQMDNSQWHALRLSAKSGDRNTCVAVSPDAGNWNSGNVEADKSYLIFETVANGDPIDRRADNWVIELDQGNSISVIKEFPNGSVIPFSMAFLNPFVGEGSFYYTEPHKTDYSTDQMNWPSNTRVCNTVAKVCRYWARGDDKIYRVVYEDYTVPDYEEWEL